MFRLNLAEVLSQAKGGHFLTLSVMRSALPADTTRVYRRYSRRDTLTLSTRANICKVN